MQSHESGPPLGDIIIERGFAGPEPPVSPPQVDVGSSDESETPTATDPRAQPAEDADWRRSLFRLAEAADKDPPAAAQAQTRDRKRRGVRARAVHRLDGYLSATAAELDERGETLRQRSLALDEQAERLTALESALDERARRISELGIRDDAAARQVDDLVEVVAQRDARIQHLAHEHDAVKSELALAQEMAAKDEQAHAAQTRELERMREMFSERTERASELEREVAEKEKQLAAAQEKLHELRAQNTTMTALRARAEASLAKRDRALRDLEARLEEELRRQQAASDETSADTERRRQASSHLLFVPGPGHYGLIERAGPPPNVGEQITQGEEHERRFLVTRVGESPLPFDTRECAYLQPND